MIVWKAAFLFLLLALSRSALAEDILNFPPQQHDDSEEAASDEPPVDDESEEKEDGEEQEDGDDTPDEATPEVEIKATRAQLETLHAKIDADRNGKLSVDEILQLLHEVRKSVAVRSGKELFEGMDPDGDGKVSLDDLMKEMYGAESYIDEIEDEKEKEKLILRKKSDESKFKAADGNNDGHLDELELAAFFAPELHDDVVQVATENLIAERDHSKDGALQFHEFAESMTSVGSDPALEDKEMAWFTRMDKDEDGKVGVDELRPWHAGHIMTTEAIEGFMKVADSDNDGHLTLEELHTANDQTDEEHSDARSYFMEMVQHHEL